MNSPEVDQKFRFNFFDIIVTVAIVVAAIAIVIFRISGADNSHGTPGEIEYIVRVEKIDRSLADDFLSYKGDFRTAEDKTRIGKVVSVESEEYSALWEDSTSPLSTVIYDDYVDLSVKIRADALIMSDDAILINGVTLKKGVDLRFNTPPLEGEGIVVSIEQILPEDQK